MLTTIYNRVQAIKQWLVKHNYDAIIIPHEDEYLNEYLPEYNERLQWSTGFTGSAGAAIITLDHAAIFVDGRYGVQVTKQVDPTLFSYHDLISNYPIVWIEKNVPHSSVIAIDPSLHSCSWLEMMQNKLAANFDIKLITKNPIDLLWLDRPTINLSSVRLMPFNLTGKSSSDKRQEIAQLIKQKNIHSVIITALDSICWLLNIRGLDVPCLPVVTSHAILYADGTLDYFIDQKRLPNNFHEHVGSGVNIYSPQQLENKLAAIANYKIQIDPTNCNAWFYIKLKSIGANVLHAKDPCVIAKASKNSAEILGMRSCHIRDGVAMVKFLSWLDNEVANNRLHSEALLADKLGEIRKLDPMLVDFSFQTISAAVENAAMCHYRHQDQTKPTTVQLNTLYLVDSGGQYLDGTTDITRTVAIGAPSKKMIQQFTLVLKGHISLASAKFPLGTCGYQLDSLARQHLWSHGYDYEHGTGHGVGHFLSVHEGPASISKRQIDAPLLEGMILSNEPGYYFSGNEYEQGFGIRIENLELVTKVKTNGDFSVLQFQSLTRCPIDKRNIDLTMLTTSEISWLNTYHQLVWNDLNSLMTDKQELEWLRQATMPVNI